MSNTKKKKSSFLNLLKTINRPKYRDLDISTNNMNVNWEHIPELPLVGDTLTITGSTDPEAKVKVKVSFEKKVPVIDGKYEYNMDKVEIPDGPNKFTIKGRKAKDLSFSVKMFITYTRTFEANSDEAVYSEENVPSGKYDISIHGQAKEGEKEVTIYLEAAEIIDADNEGKFTYDYNTAALPAGDFNLLVGDSDRKITLSAAM
ncbi:hypothetical protein Metho_0326 [Methanomethylovorans hollandica DSM 15978]|uniref:Uncharacterized protein n=1 Tax=Methanomethylovorans hollandica (strain DSM 15978 / NBRC 107637 / DMS1) TaxID=867904 RepID=L0KX87_METHD|nr:hypothetical protein [Methanomethylovorans hollandica]AGB48599.1 hypothetical protein Metho_0326 [Methanomethylovorans hollandica DSM 15978]